METLDVLQSASPFVALLFTVMWVVNRVLSHRERTKGDPQLQRLSDSIVRLDAALEKRAKHDTDVIAGLTRIEAVLLQNGSFLRSNDDEDGIDRKGMSLRNQRLMIEYQWSWCRDEFVKIIAKSIRNNGIDRSPSRVARKVVAAWGAAAKDANESVDRLEGDFDYEYSNLFKRHTEKIMRTVWDWSLPLYHREIGGGTFDAAIEDLSIRIRNVFEVELNEYFSSEDDPDTGNIRRPKSGTRSGEYGMADSLVEALNDYRKGSSSYGTITDS